MGIEDILMHDESLFQNINAFDPDYLPPNYNYRDTQMEAMAMAIRPAMRGGQPSNAVVLGSPATGKTTAIKKVYELVEKNTEKVVCVYINCQLHTTRFGIISQVHKKIFGFLPPETGVPFARIYEKVMLELQKNNQSLILALDDVNYLFQSTLSAAAASANGPGMVESPLWFPKKSLSNVIAVPSGFSIKV